MVVYELMESVVQEKDTSPYWACGIVAKEDGAIRESLPDVSVNRDFVVQLIHALNEGEASTLHFREIVEDFVAVR